MRFTNLITINVHLNAVQMGQEEAQKKKDAKEKARQDAEKARQTSKPPPQASSQKSADESKVGPPVSVKPPAFRLSCCCAARTGHRKGPASARRLQMSA